MHAGDRRGGTAARGVHDGRAFAWEQGRPQGRGAERAQATQGKWEGTRVMVVRWYARPGERKGPRTRASLRTGQRAEDGNVPRTEKTADDVRPQRRMNAREGSGWDAERANVWASEIAETFDRVTRASCPDSAMVICAEMDQKRPRKKSKLSRQDKQGLTLLYFLSFSSFFPIPYHAPRQVEVPSRNSALPLSVH